MPLGLSLALGKMSYVGGKVPYSNEKFAYFDGTEYAAVLNGTQIESLTNSDFSFQYWVYDPTPITGYHSGMGDVNAIANNIGIRFLNIGSYYIQPQVQLNGQGNAAFSNITSTYTTTGWNHFVLTCSLGAGASDRSTVKTYVNGTLVSTNANGPRRSDHEASTIESTQKWGIGARVDNTGSSADGYQTAHIDEVGFWSTALDADAVSALYNSGTSIALDEDSGNYDNSSSLEYWFRLEGDLSDSTGNASDGTEEGTISYQTSTGPNGSITPP